MIRILRYTSLLALWLSLSSLVLADEPSSKVCQIDIVESMPDKLVFNRSISLKPIPTHKSLINMIKQSQKSLRLASFYVTLTPEAKYQDHPSTEPGKNIMKAIEEAVGRGVNLQVVLDRSSSKSMSSKEDIEKLESLGSVKFVDMRRLLKAGVLHTKFLIVDNQTFYMGSSNFDWRSYTQIKEIGVTLSDCQTMAEDLDKVFRTYMIMSGSDVVPERLPEDLKTSINIDHPLILSQAGSEVSLFLGSSPPAFNGISEWTGRTDDIDGLLSLIEQAQHRVDISVMNYSPATQFIWPKKFWPRIEDALRRAAVERKVRVRLLVSDWPHVKPEERIWYRSLNSVRLEKVKGGSVEVKMFKVPAFDDFQKNLEYARVKHDKYMVTDSALYVGTSNWTPDYFINTCGVSLVLRQNDTEGLVEGMAELFDRDFTSEFSHDLDQ